MTERIKTRLGKVERTDATKDKEHTRCSKCKISKETKDFPKLCSHCFRKRNDKGKTYYATENEYIYIVLADSFDHAQELICEQYNIKIPVYKIKRLWQYTKVQLND